MEIWTYLLVVYGITAIVFAIRDMSRSQQTTAFAVLLALIFVYPFMPLGVLTTRLLLQVHRRDMPLSRYGLRSAAKNKKQNLRELTPSRWLISQKGRFRPVTIILMENATTVGLWLPGRRITVVLWK